MTDPTNLRARAEDERPCDLMARVSRLARIGVIVEAWRADDDADGVDAIAAIAAILRESAPPPEAPGERRPVAGWRAGVSADELFVGTFLRLRAGAIAWEVEAVKTRGLARWCDTLKSGIVTGGPVAAKLAAEDAADALLLAGRRALGRVA